LLLNISRISQDLIMFSGDEMPVFTLPEGFVTGSSLMANKRNPDFLEMVQGYTSEIIGKFNSLLGMVANKSSGYHRDFQISKKILVNIFQRVKMILDPLPDFFSGLTVNSGAAGLSIKNSSYATANAKAMFSLGASWKDSYSQVGKRILEGEKLDEIKPGSILSVDESDIRAVEDSVESGIKEIIRAREDLIGKARKLLDR
ncbi:MAG TPA: lyase family protein, partial [Thermoplasmataceae archaeon]|nr:lyase family protein [Thermoplasmataceae archaeon]